jgi:hypothetical protein
MSGSTPADEQTRCRVCPVRSPSSENLTDHSQDLTGQVTIDDMYFAYGGFSWILDRYFHWYSNQSMSPILLHNLEFHTDEVAAKTLRFPQGSMKVRDVLVRMACFL